MQHRQPDTRQTRQLAKLCPEPDTGRTLHPTRQLSSRYGANRDVYKVAFRTRYEANEAACKVASKATYRAKREQVRSVYLLDSAQNRAACAKRYACMGTKIRAQLRGRYALREPNDDVKLSRSSNAN